MSIDSTSISAYADSKKHYQILDALRGVAAVTVVIFHLLETFTGGDHTKQIINHGYMAVDFFFLLSGFVIGYAYDDRWNKMSLGGFFKRRLIRLHPMIVMAMLIGAITFYFQDCQYFNNIAGVPVWKLLLVMLIGFTLLPVPSSLDIRGWTEMHPLVGPAWTLFFEYIANILYALILRRLPNAILAILVFIAGAALIHLAVTSPQGDIIGGWAIDPTQLRIGFTRLLYPFLAGLLLSRIVKPGKINNAFLLSSILLLIVLAIPRVGGHERLWMNGLYDSLSIVLIFPIVVYIGASGEIKDGISSKISKFLGDISYPIYIIHYPFIYMYVAFVAKHPQYSDGTAPNGMLILVLVALLVLFGAIILAYLIVKFYDVPVRKWLTKKFMSSGAK
ncbi:MAG: acyltransferase [Sphingobacteriales bacterium]|nr:acyltransferase [Sphingobacteriales bacterium]